MKFGIESLEDRRMMAVDVDFVGSTLRITGDDLQNFVTVSTAANGNITVDHSTPATVLGDGSVTAPTFGTTELFATSVDRLIIDVKGGDDAVTIRGTGSNPVTINKRTVVKLGSTEIGSTSGNTLSIGGSHKSLRVIGGNGTDRVAISDGVLLAKSSISLKSGSDGLFLDAGRTGDAISDGRFSVLDSIDQILETPPKLRVNLGSGDDLVGVIKKPTVESPSEFASDAEFASISNPLAILQATADLTGQRLPNIFNINGGSGLDALSPNELKESMDTVGTVRGFEIEFDASV